MRTKDAAERVRLLGQLDLGAAAEVLTGETFWSIQRRIATALSRPRAKVAVPSCNASGKGLLHGTPVITPDGVVPVEEITPGDVVIDRHGLPTVVLGVFPQPEQPVYRFEFNDGTSITTDAAHLWQARVRTAAGDKTEKTLSTAEIIERWGLNPTAPNRIELPPTEPAQLSRRDVPLDPYLLGLLLGDGGLTSGVTISTTDPEIVAAFGDAVGRFDGRCTYYVKGLRPVLRRLGLLGRRSWEKTVPEDYLWNDVDTRLGLLQGLMDSDGGPSGAGHEFSSTSQGLAEAVVFLVQSLGGTARISSKTTPGRPSYRVRVTTPVCPYRLERKAAQWRRHHASRRKTYGRVLHRIVPAGVGRTTCLRVDSPSATFLTTGFAVTHNTWQAARYALAFYNAFTPGTPCVQCDPDGTKGGCRGSKVITTSSKESHLRDNLWGEIRAAYPKIRDRGIYIPGQLYEGDLRLVDNESNHFIIGQSAASAEGMQGYHAAHKLIIGDEATSVDEEVQLAITRLLASSDSRILLIYNPTTPDTYASKMARSASFETIRITAWDTPNLSGEGAPDGSNLITQAFLDDLVAQGMGPGTFEWVTSIEAKDWDTGDDLLIPAGWYDKQTRRESELGRGTRQLGIDIAAYGSDENIIAIRDGNQLVEVRAFPSMMVEQYVRGPVTKAVLDYQPDVIVFDGDGVGAGAVGYFEDLKRLMRPGAAVIGFRGGKGVSGRFTNQRAQWYWSLRRRFENQAIEVTVHDDKLRAQAIDLHYTVTPQGDIRVETKQEMRKRGLSSPDRLDGVMYAFAFSDELAATADAARPGQTAADVLGLADHSIEAMWRRTVAGRTDRRQDVNPVLDCSDDW